MRRLIREFVEIYTACDDYVSYLETTLFSVTQKRVTYRERTLSVINPTALAFIASENLSKNIS